MPANIPLRHELKFFISEMQYQVLSRQLDRVLWRDPNGDENNEYHIRSLYFDTVFNDAYFDHTWRRAKSFAAGTDQQCVRVKFTKDELGFVIGRQSLAIAAITDVSMALAFLTALGEPEKHKAQLEVLSTKAAKARQRQKEAKSHKRNVRMGKKK